MLEISAIRDCSPTLIRPFGPPSPVGKALGACGFAVNFRKIHCHLPGGAEPRPYQLRSLPYFTPFIVRLIRPRFWSTSRTATLTTSPTETTSDGCLMNLLLTCEICTSPS